MPLLGSKKNAANKSSRNATRKKFHKLEEMTSVALWERTFECRKQTVMKKAKELELSCGVLVTVTIQTQSGLVYFYSSNSQITDILQTSGLLGSQSVNMASCMQNQALNLSEIKNFQANFNASVKSTSSMSTSHAEISPKVSSTTRNLKRQNVLSRLASMPTSDAITCSSTTTQVTSSAAEAVMSYRQNMTEVKPSVSGAYLATSRDTFSSPQRDLKSFMRNNQKEYSTENQRCIKRKQSFDKETNNTIKKLSNHSVAGNDKVLSKSSRFAPQSDLRKFLKNNSKSIFSGRKNQRFIEKEQNSIEGTKNTAKKRPVDANTPRHAEPINDDINFVLPEISSQKNKNASTKPDKVSSSESESSSDEDATVICKTSPRPKPVLKQSKSGNVVNLAKSSKKWKVDPPQNSAEESSDSSESDDSSDLSKSDDSSDSSKSTVSSTSESVSSSSSSVSSTTTSDDDVTIVNRRSTPRLIVKSSSEDEIERASGVICADSSAAVSSGVIASSQSVEGIDKTTQSESSKSKASHIPTTTNCDKSDSRPAATSSISFHTPTIVECKLKKETSITLHGSSQSTTEDNKLAESPVFPLSGDQSELGESIDGEALFNDLKSKGIVRKKRDSCNYVIVEDLMNGRDTKKTEKPFVKLSRLPHFPVVQNDSEPVYVLENIAEQSKKRNTKTLKKGSPKKTNKSATNNDKTPPLCRDVKSEDRHAKTPAVIHSDPDCSRVQEHASQAPAGIGDSSTFGQLKRSESFGNVMLQSNTSVFAKKIAKNSRTDKRDKKPVICVAENLNASKQSEELDQYFGEPLKSEEIETLDFLDDLELLQCLNDEFEPGGSDTPGSSRDTAVESKPVVSELSTPLSLNANDKKNSQLLKNNANCGRNIDTTPSIAAKVKIERSPVVENKVQAASKRSEDLRKPFAAFDGVDDKKSPPKRRSNSSSVDANDRVKNELFPTGRNRTMSEHDATCGDDNMVEKNTLTKKSDHFVNENSFFPTSFTRYPQPYCFTDFTSDELPEVAKFKLNDVGVGRKRKLCPQQDSSVSSKRLKMNAQRKKANSSDKKVGKKSTNRKFLSTLKSVSEKATKPSSQKKATKKIRPLKQKENTKQSAIPSKKLNSKLISSKKSKNLNFKEKKVSSKKAKSLEQNEKTKSKKQKPTTSKTLNALKQKGKTTAKKKLTSAKNSEIKAKDSTKKSASATKRLTTKATKNCMSRKTNKLRKFDENSPVCEHDKLSPGWVSGARCRQLPPFGPRHNVLHKPNYYGGLDKGVSYQYRGQEAVSNQEYTYPSMSYTNPQWSATNRGSIRTKNRMSNLHSSAIVNEDKRISHDGPSLSENFYANSTNAVENMNFENRPVYGLSQTNFKSWRDFYQTPKLMTSYVAWKNYCKQIFEQALSAGFMKKNPNFRKEVEKVEKQYGYVLIWPMITIHRHFSHMHKFLYDVFVTRNERYQFLYDSLVTSKKFHVDRNTKGGQVRLIRERS